MKARCRRQDECSKQDRQGADADHDQDELKERHDAHHTVRVMGSAPFVALVARSALSPPAPSEATTKLLSRKNSKQKRAPHFTHSSLVINRQHRLIWKRKLRPHKSPRSDDGRWVEARTGRSIDVRPTLWREWFTD